MGAIQQAGSGVVGNLGTHGLQFHFGGGHLLLKFGAVLLQLVLQLLQLGVDHDLLFADARVPGFVDEVHHLRSRLMHLVINLHTEFFDLLDGTSHLALTVVNDLFAVV